MDEGFSSRGGEAVTDFSNIMEVKGLDDGADMGGIEGEGGVQDETMVASQGGRGDGQVVDGVIGPVLMSVDLVPMRRCSVLSLISLRKLCCG